MLKPAAANPNARWLLVLAGKTSRLCAMNAAGAAVIAHSTGFPGTHQGIGASAGLKHMVVSQ